MRMLTDTDSARRCIVVRIDVHLFVYIGCVFLAYILGGNYY